MLSFRRHRLEIKILHYCTPSSSLVAQSVKNLPALQETRGQSLVWEDPLEKEIATHSSILARKISWAVEPGGLQSMGWQRVGHDWVAELNWTDFIFPASMVAQMVKSLPALQENGVRSLCWKDPLEKEIATHSSILAWKIPWTEEPGKLPSMGLQRVRQDWATSHSSFLLISYLRLLQIAILYL